MREEKLLGKKLKKEKIQARNELSKLKCQLNDAYCAFNSTNDQDSLEACIFEISALSTRYNSALKDYRQKFFN